MVDGLRDFLGAIGLIAKTALDEPTARKKSDNLNGRGRAPAGGDDADEMQEELSPPDD